MSKQKNKTKAAALRAVMGNKKLADDIFAGQSAPHGSTKRKKASSILQSVYSGLNPDGLGSGISALNQDPDRMMPAPSPTLQVPPTLGPGMSSPPRQAPVQIAPTLDSMLSFNEKGRAVTSQEREEEEKKALVEQSGRMLPGSRDIYGPSDIGRIGASIDLSKTGGAETSYDKLTLPSDKKMPSSTPKIGEIREFGELPKPPQPPQQTEPQMSLMEPQMSLSEDASKSAPTYHDANTAYNACMNSSVADLGGKTQHDYCYLEAQKTTGKTPTLSATSQFSPESSASTAVDTSPIDLQDMMEYAYATGDTSEIEALIAELKRTNPEMADQIEPQVSANLDAIAQGVSLQEFMTRALFNPKAISDRLGIPLDIMETFTFDLFGGEKAEDLEEIARQKFQLNAWESALMDRQAEHLTASVKFKDYIRGKDQYLGKLDEMLYKLGEQRNNIDMSDPEMATRFQNYQNYLTGLKGAQSKRYIDILNDSIQVEQANYDRFKSLYETKVQQVSDFVTQQLEQQNIDQQRAKELLPYITDSLTGIYRAANGIDDINEEKYRLNKDKLLETVNIINTLKDIDIDVEKLKEINPELAQYMDIIDTDSVKSVLSGGDRELTEARYNSAVKRMREEDGRITSIQPLGIKDLIEHGMDLQLENIGLLIKDYGTDVSMYVEDEIAENGNFQNVLNPFTSVLEAEIDSLNDVETELMSGYIDKIYDGAAKGMRKYLVEYEADTMQKIMRKMLNGKIESEEELKNKYGEEIDPYLLETLWAADEALRQETLEGSPGMYETLEDVPHFGIDKSMWKELLSDPDAMASYFLGEI